MVVEYAVVIRRQLGKGQLRWQLWSGGGMEKEDPSFLTVMNHAGALGYEAVAAGHFDDLGVPEVLLQRKMGTSPAIEAPLLPAPTLAAAPKALVPAGAPKLPVPVKRAARKKNPEAAKK